MAFEKYEPSPWEDWNNDKNKLEDNSKPADGTEVAANEPKDKKTEPAKLSPNDQEAMETAATHDQKEAIQMMSQVENPEGLWPPTVSDTTSAYAKSNIGWTEWGAWSEIFKA